MNPEPARAAKLLCPHLTIRPCQGPAPVWIPDGPATKESNLAHLISNIKVSPTRLPQLPKT